MCSSSSKRFTDLGGVGREGEGGLTFIISLNLPMVIIVLPPIVSTFGTAGGLSADTHLMGCNRKHMGACVFKACVLTNSSSLFVLRELHHVLI